MKTNKTECEDILKHYFDSTGIFWCRVTIDDIYFIIDEKLRMGEPLSIEYARCDLLYWLARHNVKPITYYSKRWKWTVASTRTLMGHIGVIEPKKKSSKKNTNSAKKKNEKTVVLEKKQNNTKLSVSNQSQTDTSNISSKASANATTPTNQGHSINSIEIKGNEYKRKDNVVCTQTPLQKMQKEISKYWRNLDEESLKMLFDEYLSVSADSNTPELLDIMKFCRTYNVNIFKVIEIITIILRKNWNDSSGDKIKNWKGYILSICKHKNYFGYSNINLSEYTSLSEWSSEEEDDDDYEDDTEPPF